MNPLKMQTNAEGSFITYKLGQQESLDRMTMGMIRNNRIKGLLPLNFSQIDSERWIKYEITSMVPLQTYLSGVLTRKKTLNLFSQVADTFLLVEDYMIDASFIILDSKFVYVNAVTGEIGIICLPLSGFVGNVTLKDFVGNITRTVQFDSRENCDYVAKILNFTNSSGFSITGLKKLLDELVSESVQRIQRKNPDGVMMGGGMTPFEEVNGQMAVTVESVAGMVSNPIPQMNAEPQGIRENGNIPPVGGMSTRGGIVSTVQEQKAPKEKKGLFGKKKKKEQPNVGMAIPGMSVPGMKENRSMTAPQTAMKAAIAPAPGPILSPNGNPGISVPDEQDLSGIASQINGKRPMTTISSKPEWSISPDFETKVGISDGTIMLNVEMDPPAVLRRLRNRETTVIENGELVIGKDRNSVDYCISDNSTISRVHAKIIRREKQYFIKDNNSMNHTYVNDRQVLGGQEVMIENGDRIRLSDEEFIFSL